MEPQPLTLEAPEPLDAAAVEWLERCQMAYGEPGPETVPAGSIRYGLAVKHLGGQKAEYEPHLWEGFVAAHEVTPYNDGVRDFALQALGAGHVSLAERILAGYNTRGEETLAGQGFAEHVAGRIAEAKGNMEEAASRYTAGQGYFEKAHEEGATRHHLETHNGVYLTIAERRVHAGQPAGTLALRAQGNATA